MERMLFYDELKAALSHARNLQDVEEIIQKELEKVSNYTIGFVVGKVTPSGEETRDANLAILEKRTKEIAEKELEKGIVVFSSSVIPPFIEQGTHVDEFYTFWENIVEKYAEILYITPGYELSKGASSEIALAQKMEKEIMSYEDVIMSKK